MIVIRFYLYADAKLDIFIIRIYKRSKKFFTVKVFCKYGKCYIFIIYDFTLHYKAKVLHKIDNV